MMMKSDPALFGVILVAVAGGLAALRYRATHKNVPKTLKHVKAVQEREISFHLGEGSSISAEILDRVLLKFDGITGHLFDGHTLQVRGTTPADEITNNFVKIGTQFILEGPPEMQLHIEGMMCQKNCASSVQRLLLSQTGVSDAHVYFSTKTALIRGVKLSPPHLIEAISSIGYDAKLVEAKSARSKSKRKSTKFNSKPKHACIREVAFKDEVDAAFLGVRKHYKEQQLQEYSRYKNWKQSCYMEVHPTWNPQPPINEELFKSMEGLLIKGKEAFAKWYKELHGLADVEVITLNSFITKYIPKEGKDEFGKHVDGAKIDGSMILALPTDEPHDWPGIRIWDGPKGADGNRPEHLYKLNPGDVCCMDSLVWHHGLPITKGARYVCVCFYKCRWKQVKHK